MSMLYILEMSETRLLGVSSTDGEKSPSVEPRAFKYLVGKGHSEFSTNRQQDACEYLQHLLASP